jgi:hypothetical protein
MSTTVHFDEATRTAQGTAWITNIDSGAAAGVLKVYAAGSTPATPEAALPGDAVLLTTHTLSDPCATATSAVVTFDAISSAVAAANGTARFARIEDSDGTVRGQMDAAGADAAIVFNDPVFVSGATISIISLAVTVGG